MKVALALAVLLAAALPVRAELLPFDEAERAQILSHGPWPPAIPADPGNRLSGRPDAIALGATLFSEARLSGDGSLSCASCHQPQRAWTDGRRLSRGRQDLDRHAPGLWNAGLQRWLGWDGASDSLWSAAIRPILDGREMGGSIAGTARLVREDAGLSCRFRAATGSAPGALEDEALLVLAAKALAAFQETLVSPRTPFDEFRDALAAGDSQAAARYPVAAQRGLKLFLGRGNCSFCHAGPAFTNGEFHDTGLPFFMASGRPDPGRHGGIKSVRENPYNRLSPHSDDPTGASAFPVRHVALLHRNWGEFRTPGLRELRHTAPYMHNGAKATLGEVVRHYADLDPDRLHADGEAILRAFPLSEAEAGDLVAFLESLSSPEADGSRRLAEAAATNCAGK